MNFLVADKHDYTSRYIDEVTDQIKADLDKKKEDLIITKLKEKGFGHYADTIMTARFPKVICEVGSNGWSLYWADDGSEKGAFIVAIGPYHFEENCELNKMTIKFGWNDKLPIVYKEAKP